MGMSTKNDEISGRKKHTGSKLKRIRNISVLLIVTGLLIFLSIRFYYPFGEGVKTGRLNYVVYKGVVFKTYEGKLIQSGLRSDKSGGLQSNEFIFSVVNKEIAERLMKAGGQTVELRYKEYFGALPWRGYSKFIVTEIIDIKPYSVQDGLDTFLPDMQN